MPKIIKKCILKRQLAYAIMAVAKKEIIKSKQHTPPFCCQIGCDNVAIISYIPIFWGEEESNTNV